MRQNILPLILFGLLIYLLVLCLLPISKVFFLPIVIVLLHGLSFNHIFLSFLFIRLYLISLFDHVIVAFELILRNGIPCGIILWLVERRVIGKECLSFYCESI
jgi:hypothetical protein